MAGSPIYCALGLGGENYNPRLCGVGDGAGSVCLAGLRGASAYGGGRRWGGS